MAQCPACHATTFDGSRCGGCGYEEAPIYELPLEAVEDAEPLSLDALEPFAPESHMSADVEPLDIDPMEDMEPMVLETSELSEPVERIEGFEGTAIEERARPKKKIEAPRKQATAFVHQVCPSCEAPVATPNPPFCEACGTKLLSRKKAPKEEELSLRCGECGTRNPSDRSVCRNCGSRLKTAEH
jgi:hypothetical protein